MLPAPLQTTKTRNPHQAAPPALTRGPERTPHSTDEPAWSTLQAAYGNQAVLRMLIPPGVGQACVFTTLVIAGGFWILCYSRFLPTAYFGALVGLTMLTALACDLLLLPTLLSIFNPVKPRSVWYTRKR